MAGRHVDHNPVGFVGVLELGGEVVRGGEKQLAVDRVVRGVASSLRRSRSPHCWIRRTFSAEAASAEVAEALHIAQGAPVQYMQQVTYLVDGRPIEYSDVWIQSERLKVTSLLSRR